MKVSPAALPSILLMLPDIKVLPRASVETVPAIFSSLKNSLASTSLPRRISKKPPFSRISNKGEFPLLVRVRSLFTKSTLVGRVDSLAPYTLRSIRSRISLTALSRIRLSSGNILSNISRRVCVVSSTISPSGVFSLAARLRLSVA